MDTHVYNVNAACTTTFCFHGKKMLTEASFLSKWTAYLTVTRISLFWSYVFAEFNPLKISNFVQQFLVQISPHFEAWHLS